MYDCAPHTGLLLAEPGAKASETLALELQMAVCCVMLALGSKSSESSISLAP